MAGYALLILPSANRVYTSASTILTQSELRVFNHSGFDGRLCDLSATAIGGVPYVTFTAADPITARDAARATCFGRCRWSPWTGSTKT